METRAAAGAELLFGLALGSSPAVVPEPEALLRRLRAARLPRVRWCGLELGLQPGAGWVDVHQAFYPTRAELGRLHAYLQEARPGEPLTNLVARCRKHSVRLARYVDYLVVELDTLPTGALAPSLFLALQPGLEPRLAPGFVRRFLAAAAVDPDSFAAIDRCFRACRDEERITHVGLMLARDDAPVRLNVRGIPAWRLRPFLEATGYGHDVDRTVALFERYSRYADRVIVCLDVRRQLLPRIGLEVTLLGRPANEPRFKRLGQRLAQDQGVDRQRFQALLEWCGTESVAGMPQAWPDDLLLDSLTHPADRFAVIERYFSHVKLAVDAPPKAYLGIHYGVLVQEGPAGPDVAVGARADTPAAIDTAAAYLLNKRHPCGLWRDYPGCTVSYSDEYTSAWVGYMLGEPGMPSGCEPVCRDVLDRLLRAARADGGWGWSAWIAGDADTTSWVLRLAQRFGAKETSAFSAGRRFLAHHQAEDGGVASYDRTLFERFHSGHGAHPERFDEWCHAHMCVTAACADVAGFGESARAFLLRSQSPAGHWDGYWWADAVFPTALACDALAQGGGARCEAAIAAAQDWVRTQVTPCGGIRSTHTGEPTPFATAAGLWVLSASASPDRTTGNRLADWLLARQRQDGSWVASAFMFDPHGTPAVSMPDSERLHTTALVCLALRRWHGVRN